MNTKHVIDDAHPILNAGQIDIKINTTQNGNNDSVSVSMESSVSLGNKLNELSIGDGAKCMLANTVVNYEVSPELINTSSKCPSFSLGNWPSNVTSALPNAVLNKPIEKFHDFSTLPLDITSKNEGCLVSDFQNILMPSAALPSIIANSSEEFPNVFATGSKVEYNEESGSQLSDQTALQTDFTMHFSEANTCDSKSDNRVEFSSFSSADSTSVSTNLQAQHTSDFGDFSVNGKFNDVSTCSESSEHAPFSQTIPAIPVPPKLPNRNDSFDQLSENLNNQTAGEAFGNFAKFESRPIPFPSTATCSITTSSYQTPESKPNLCLI